MAYVYENLNTGQVVEREDRSARFDASPNWREIKPPGANSSDEQEVTPTPPSEPERQHLFDVYTPGAMTEEGTPTPAAPEVERPTRNASRLEWAEYALSQGADPAKVADMKRDELVAEFGG